MKPTEASLERRLANEQRMHAEAFGTLAASFDRVIAERDAAQAELADVRFRQKSRAWFRFAAPLLALLLAACAYEAQCADPVTVPQSWTHVSSTCPERLRRPNIDECAQVAFADMDACEAAGRYRCSDGVEVIVSVNSELGTGSYVVRNADGCESRFTMGGGS